MTKPEFLEVMSLYAATWQHSRLREDVVEAWYGSMARFHPASATEAIRQLGEEVEVMPPLATLMAKPAAIDRETLGPDSKAARPPAPTPKDYPETPYLAAAKKLTIGIGHRLLMTPPSVLTDSQRDVRQAVLDCARRHGIAMDAGLKPNAEMLEEVITLASAVEAVTNGTVLAEARR